MNEALRAGLLAMQDEDQRTLNELGASGELGSVPYHPRMKAVHERNSARLKEIVTQHGWPGSGAVGKDGAEAAWLIAQHAVMDTEFMTTCLDLLRAAVARGEAEGWCLAYLEDRVLTMSGQPQIYGTQHDVDANGVTVPMPIDDPRAVDARRAQLGLEPLAQATARLQQRENEIRRNRGKFAIP